MTGSLRSFLYAGICIGLIVLIYFQLPASFYTLSTILGLLAIFFASKGWRAGSRRVSNR